MDKWEYKMEIMSDKKSKDYSESTLGNHLDYMGGLGWELVTLQPVHGTGPDGILYKGADAGYSNLYLCVFKRRR